MPRENMTPVYREDYDELLGYIVEKNSSFQVLMFFEYQIATTAI